MKTGHLQPVLRIEHHGKGVACPLGMHKAHVVSMWHCLCQPSAVLSELQHTTVVQDKGAKCLRSDYTGSEDWVERTQQNKEPRIISQPVMTHITQTPTPNLPGSTS